MTRRLAVVAVSALVFAASVDSATGAGGATSVYSSAGHHGIASADGGTRFVALHARDQTVVARIHAAGGRVELARSVQGFLDIPAVQGDATGLSGDERTLVLGSPYVLLGQPGTRFLLLDTERLRPTASVRLHGAFAFDAISPDGSLLYLTQYQSPRDPTAYAIRTYDVEAERLRAAPVIDPTEPEEEMRGVPVARAESAGGRWAYTLYDGNGEMPFVHALDTAHATARCIDLDGLDLPANLSRATLALSDGGGRLAVGIGGTQVGSVDTATFEVTPAAAAGSGDGADGGDGLPLGALIAALGVVAGAAVLALLIRRRPAPSAP